MNPGQVHAAPYPVDFKGETLSFEPLTYERIHRWAATLAHLTDDQRAYVSDPQRLILTARAHADSLLRFAIAEALGKQRGEPVTDADLAALGSPIARSGLAAGYVMAYATGGERPTDDETDGPKD